MWDKNSRNPYLVCENYCSRTKFGYQGLNSQNAWQISKQVWYVCQGPISVVILEHLLNSSQLVQRILDFSEQTFYPKASFDPQVRTGDFVAIGVTLCLEPGGCLMHQAIEQVGHSRIDLKVHF